MNRLYENIGYKKTQTQNFIDRYNSEQDTKYHKQLLVNISDKSKENEVQVILVIFPLLYDFENYDFYGAHQFISEIGEENNMQVIDLLYAFQNEDPKELILSKYDSHPNEKANYIAAEFITTRFINNCSINQTCQITNQ